MNVNHDIRVHVYIEIKLKKVLWVANLFRQPRLGRAGRGEGKQSLQNS